MSILVNCAGGDIGARGTKPNPNGALDISLDDAMAVLQRNFIGTMLMCRRVVPGMAAKKRGTVINFGSLNAHMAVSPEVVYGCAKAAIVHYTRCLALEMRPMGVRVNAISPGPTKTARFMATRETDPEMVKDGYSLERYANPAEIADAVAFLASDQASFISGQVLRIDGGVRRCSREIPRVANVADRACYRCHIGAVRSRRSSPASLRLPPDANRPQRRHSDARSQPCFRQRLRTFQKVGPCSYCFELIRWRGDHEVLQASRPLHILALLAKAHRCPR